MKITEITSRYLKSYVGMVKCIAPGMGNMSIRVAVESDSLMGARYALARIYGKENVMSVQQLLGEKLLNDAQSFGADNKPLSPQQLQVKSLNDQSKKLKDQAKKVKARQSVQSAQAKLAKANQTVVSDQFS
jgi:acetyl-CoA carboxylase beta subunit